ncbi:MAG: 3-hydroxyacyl-CoA dehydrogenase NAD-binding domain-containing protein [Pseudomonadota bacterium]
MSIQESLKITPKGDVALIEWDHVGEKVNKMSTPIMARLEEIIKELNSSSYKAAVIISRKKKIFIAGADINEIKGLKTEDDFAQAVQGGQDILNRIEDLKIPVIAAIHGACAGGGCELSLACDYRIASDAKETRIGLPEVQLGIIPGFGGSVRLPRVVGIQAALDIILAGKLVPSKKALKIGLIDKMVHPAILEEQALAMAADIIKKGGKKRPKTFAPKGFMNKVLESPLGRSLVFSQATKMTMKKSHGHYPAVLSALGVVKKTAGYSDRAKAMKIEKEGFCKVAGGEVSKNLINLYFMMESVKKRNGVDGDEKGWDVDHLGVLGAGTMGGGIAYVAADKGVFVRLKDISTDAIAKGFEAARGIWDKKIKRRRMTKYELNEKMGHISGGVDYAGFKQLDVVVEAIVENMDIKKKVIAETAKHLKDDCVFATNTSSLSVTEMAEAHPKPENFVGMHFFSPVHRMPLVEVIRGPQSGDKATATVFNLAKKMGKTPVVVKDAPGFLVNRLLVPYMMEAAFFLQEGASIETVDKIFVKKFGMPMGPFRLMDSVGLDVCVKVSKIFKESLGERIELPDLLLKLDQTGRLGEKSGKGFYGYKKGEKPQVDASVYTDLGLSSPTDPLSESEIIGRAMYNMVNEAALVLLEEQVVGSAEDLDLAMIMGTGFPPFRGGLLRWADREGSEKIVDDLEVFATKYGARFKPTTPLRNMAKTQRTFH